MKILYAITLPEHGGAQRHVYQLLMAGNNFGHEVMLITSSEGWLTEECKSAGIRVEIAPHLKKNISPIHDYLALREIRKIILENRPDIIHLHSSKAGLVGRLASKLSGKPSIFTAHGWAFTEGSPLKNKIIGFFSEQLALMITNRVITVSHYDEALARKWLIFNRKRVITVKNGIPDLPYVDKIKNQLPIKVVMTARFAPQKDHRTLVMAAAMVDNVHIEFIGDGELLPSIKILSRELGMEDRISFLGSRTDVSEILSRADAFALISNYEGFPISTLEAMRNALPAIVSNVGGAAEAIVPEVTGLVVPKGDVQATADALKILVQQPERRQIMGSAARKHFLDLYQEKDMLDKIFNIYEEVLQEGSNNH